MRQRNTHRAPIDQVAANLGESAVFDAQTVVRARTVDIDAVHIPAAVLGYGHPRFRAVWITAACRSQGWLTSCSPTTGFVAMNDGRALGSQLRCYLAGAGLGVDRPPS